MATVSSSYWFAGALTTAFAKHVRAPTPRVQLADARVRFTEIARIWGPERCAEALDAFAKNSGWWGCVVARAYGAPGRLHNDHEAAVQLASCSPAPDPGSIEDFAARALGITTRDVDLIVGAFDCRVGCEGLRDLLQQAVAAEAAKCGRRGVAEAGLVLAMASPVDVTDEWGDPCLPGGLVVCLAEVSS